MKTAQRWLTFLLAVSVAGAIYLSVRDVALPEASAINRAITQGEPIQAASDQRGFTRVIKGYT